MVHQTFVDMYCFESGILVFHMKMVEGMVTTLEEPSLRGSGAQYIQERCFGEPVCM